MGFSRTVVRLQTGCTAWTYRGGTTLNLVSRKACGRDAESKDATWNWKGRPVLRNGIVMVSLMRACSREMVGSGAPRGARQ